MIELQIERRDASLGRFLDFFKDFADDNGIHELRLETVKDNVDIGAVKPGKVHKLNKDLVGLRRDMTHFQVVAVSSFCRIRYGRCQRSCNLDYACRCVGATRQNTSVSVVTGMDWPRVFSRSLFDSPKFYLIASRGILPA